MNKETILSWLKTTDVPLTVISNKTGVSRKTLYNWINGSEMRRTNIDKIISPTAKGLKKSGKALKETVKKASKKLTVKNVKGALKKMKPGNKGLLGKIKPKPRKQRRTYTNNTYTEGE